MEENMKMIGGVALMIGGLVAAAAILLWGVIH